MFYMTVSVTYERFQSFNLDTNFLKNENFFKKTVVPFLVENTKV